jgi:hypothetical protein
MCMYVCVWVGIYSGCIFKYDFIVYMIHNIISRGMFYFMRECMFSFILYFNNIFLII